MKFFRLYGILVTVLALAACTSPQQRVQQQAMIEAADHEECVKLGFRPKTDAYGDCRLRLKEMRVQARSVYYGGPYMGYDFGRNGHYGRVGHYW